MSTTMFALAIPVPPNVTPSTYIEQRMNAYKATIGYSSYGIGGHYHNTFAIDDHHPVTDAISTLRNSLSESWPMVPRAALLSGGQYIIADYRASAVETDNPSSGQTTWRMNVIELLSQEPEGTELYYLDVRA